MRNFFEQIFGITIVGDNRVIFVFFSADINECFLRGGHGPCQDECQNTVGSYKCSCGNLKGTILAKDEHSCEQIDSCSVNNGGCSHICLDTIGNIKIKTKLRI